MIKRTFDITARIEQGQIPFCFQCVQNDKDVYVLRIRITDGGREIDYSQVSDVTITFALANGAVVQSDPTRLTVSATGIIYQMGTSEIACPGKVLASIQLFGEDGERLTTARFQFEVVADLITPGAVQSESRFPILQQLVADVEQLKQDIVNLQIPDGSIMDVKLSDAAGQIKQRFASHMADYASHMAEKASQNDLLKIVDYINNLGGFNGGYSWWVYPNVLKHKNKTYVTFVNGAGETIIASYDHEGGGRQNCVLQTDTESDEHNTGAIAVMNDDKIIVAYAKHNKENIIRIKISKHPNNIEYFEDAIELSTSGKVTYAQLFHMDNGIFRLYYRVNANSWAYRVSSDGITWSDEQIFLIAPSQYYIRGVKRGGQVRFVGIGHPILSNDHDFKYFYDVEGGFFTVGSGEPLSKPFTPDDLYTLKTPDLGNARLFDVSTFGGDLTFAYADFTDENNAVYKVATGNSSTGWEDKIICQAGLPLEYPLGANYYFGGMWFEWNSNKIVYVARENNGTWYIEKYQTDDFTSWELVEEINKSDNEKLHRPVIPYNGGSLVYQKGDYQDYTHYNSKVISADWFISL